MANTMIKINLKKISVIVITVLSVIIISVPVIAYLKIQSQVGDMKKTLETPVQETLEETLKADAAEIMPAVSIQPGVYTCDSVNGDFRIVEDLILEPDGTFLIGLQLAVKQKELLRETAEGTYTTKGSVLICKVIKGVPGFFPTSGRTVVKEATNSKLVLESSDKKDVPFLRVPTGESIFKK